MLGDQHNAKAKEEQGQGHLSGRVFRDLRRGGSLLGEIVGWDLSTDGCCDNMETNTDDGG